MARFELRTSTMFLFALPLAATLAACGGGAGAAGGDPIDDPANVASVDGLEGVDPGWAHLATDQEVAADAPTVEAKGANEEAVAQSSDALSTSTATSRALAVEAKRELTHLDEASSFYSHTTYVDEATGARQVDCSGFLDYALKRVAPKSYAVVPHGGVRPVAGEWHDFLASMPTRDSGKGWFRIAAVKDLHAGDVIAWNEPAGAGSSTGHVMIVAANPTKSSRTNEWLVPVIDSAISGHTSDTRGTQYTGIGSGTIGLVVDAKGAPHAYYWRGGKSTTKFTTEIALGRAT